MRNLLIASSAVSLTVLFAAFKLSRAGYESAAYQVELENGSFEIRKYPSMTLASIPMTSRDAGEDESFMRLFRYISGGNAAEKKIAMTTPVLITEGDEGDRMSFIAPQELAATGAPPATDASTPFIGRMNVLLRTTRAIPNDPNARIRPIGTFISVMSFPTRTRRSLHRRYEHPDTIVITSS